MKLRWTPQAAAELEDLYIFLEHGRPAWTHGTMVMLYDGARSLKRMPLRGRLGVEPGTRELVIENLPFLIIYKVLDDHVQILGFRHTSREPITQ